MLEKTNVFERKALFVALLALCLALPLSTFAEESTEDSVDATNAEGTSATFAEEMTVTATREDRPLDDVPAAVGLVGTEHLVEGRAEGLNSYLNAIPGVSAQTNNGASDVKLSIRGFGARSTFGVRDILVLVDGVSITDADGFTRLDQIDLASAQRVEVLKGPASAIYGNAAFGGVVNVITRHGAIGAAERRIQVESGELGFAKALASFAGGLERQRLAYAVHLSGSRLDDFREHNENEVLRLNASFDHFTNDSTTVRFLLNMSEMRDELPGSLNRQQFETDPSQVRSFFTLFDWRRDDDRYRLGGVVEHMLGRDSLLEGRLFVLTRDLDHPIFQVIDQEGLRFMGGLRWARQLGESHRLTAGFDGDREDIDAKRFRNAFGSPANLLLDNDEVIESTAVYLQDEITLGENWSLTVGGRYDRISFTETDLLLANGDTSDERTFERFSPKLGLLWNRHTAATVYLSLSNAFQVPTKSELTATTGETGFNLDLEPQKAVHIELGVRGTLKGRVRYEVSIFDTEVEDEILPRTVVNNTTIFGNVGETRHRGFEAAVDVLLGRIFELSVGYGWSDNTFTEFRGVNGNVIPGHPEHQGSVRLSSRSTGPLNGYLSFQRSGTVFLNDVNSETHRPYSTLDAGLTWDFKRLRLGVRGTNLTDELFAGWISVNDPFGNFFLPSPGRAYSASVEVRF